LTRRSPRRRPTAPPGARWRRPLEVLEDRALPSFGFLGLGSAADFALFGINGGTVSLNNASVTGSVALGASDTSSLRQADATGALVADPTATADVSRLGRGFAPAGGVVVRDLTQAAADAKAAYAVYAAMSP